MNNYQNPAAVTIKHLPTGIDASCSSDRAQHRNKAKALNLLKARIWAAANVPKPETLVASYNLPSDDSSPEDLTAFRRAPRERTNPAP